MPIGIGGGDQGQRGVGGQGCINLFPRIFSPVGRPAAGIAVGNPGREYVPVFRQALVPDAAYPGGAVRVLKQRIGIVYPCVNEADEYTASAVAQGRGCKGGSNAGYLHAGAVQKTEQPGHAVV